MIRARGLAASSPHIDLNALCDALGLVGSAVVLGLLREETTLAALVLSSLAFFFSIVELCCAACFNTNVSTLQLPRACKSGQGGIQGMSKSDQGMTNGAAKSGQLVAMCGCQRCDHVRPRDSHVMSRKRRSARTCLRPLAAAAATAALLLVALGVRRKGQLGLFCWPARTGARVPRVSCQRYKRG